MTIETFVARWSARLGPDRWHANVSLAPLTTFHVGGPADWLADVDTASDLTDLVADAAAAAIPIHVLGGGSNVLVGDAGVRGVVVRLHLTSIVQTGETVVRAGAGLTINGLVRWTIGRGLAGLEVWAGTPGTVGGAICGNAHWGGRNIGDVVRSVRLVTRRGAIASVEAGGMEFGYDTSRLQRTGEIVLDADFIVAHGQPEALRAEARRSLHYRKATQPLGQPSAGCVFQNPAPDDPVPPDVPRSAGALIDRAGLKGHRIGGAHISMRHANFIVNDQGASARDIRALIELTRRTVWERFGVELRDEVVFLGTF